MTTNVFLTTLSPIVTGPLAALKAALTNIVATPTIENAVSQGESLAIGAISPTALAGTPISVVAQEALNAVNAIEAHFASTVAAPTVATPAAVVTPEAVPVA